MRKAARGFSSSRAVSDWNPRSKFVPRVTMSATAQGGGVHVVAPTGAGAVGVADSGHVHATPGLAAQLLADLLDPVVVQTLIGRAGGEGVTPVEATALVVVLGALPQAVADERVVELLGDADGVVGDVGAIGSGGAVGGDVGRPGHVEKAQRDPGAGQRGDPHVVALDVVVGGDCRGHHVAGGEHLRDR